MGSEPPLRYFRSTVIPKSLPRLPSAYQEPSAAVPPPSQSHYRFRSGNTRPCYGRGTEELPLRLRSVTSSSPVVSILHTPDTNVLRTLTDHVQTRCKCMAYAFISDTYPPHTIFLRFDIIHTPGTDPSRPQSNHLQTLYEPAVGPFRPSTNVKRAHSHPPHMRTVPETSGNKPASYLNRPLSDEWHTFCYLTIVHLIKDA